MTAVLTGGSCPGCTVESPGELSKADVWATALRESASGHWNFQSPSQGIPVCSQVGNRALCKEKTGLRPGAAPGPGQLVAWEGGRTSPPRKGCCWPLGLSAHSASTGWGEGGGLEFLFPHRHPCVTDASGLGHAESHSLTTKEPIISGGGGREAQQGQQIAFLLLRVRDVWSSPPLPADHHLAVSFIQLRTDTGQDASVLFVA